MIVSTNWIKKYTDIDLPIDELATLIGARLVEIEEVINLGKKYQGIIISKVVAVKKHDNADKLNVCLIDDGGRIEDVERNENGYVQVVCGAPNVREGLLVAWLPPGSIVPSTYSDNEPFALGARELRGEMSNGMLASLKELDLGDDHTGIVEIDTEAEPGDDFAKKYELDDYLLDIENKSLTHRPDCFGVIGLAREIAAIQGKKFTTPEWLLTGELHFDEKTESNIIPPSVTIEDAQLSQRYQAVVLSEADQNVKSPLLIQSYLARIGQRPINAIVDTTNYLMFVTGQPLHAFDYDKFIAINDGKADIVVRAAENGETLTLLDERTITLTDQDIVICSGSTPVALAGAMGGLHTEIGSNTKNILIESATFNLYNLRGTQMRHGIFSEAITRFTKGQSARQTAPVLASASRLIMSATGAKRVTDVVEAYPAKDQEESIKVPDTLTSQLLGKEYSLDQVIQTLESVEFSVRKEKDSIEVTAPYWRGDIHIPEDVVEEIGRINGFDAISPKLPQRNFRAVEPSRFDTFRFKLRQELARAGANEIYSYSFVPEKLLHNVGQNPDHAFKIINAISPELERYRLSLAPNLLQMIHPNIKQGYETFAIFEIGKTHIKGEEEEGLPKEFDRVALVYADSNKAGAKDDGQAYYHALHYVKYLLRRFGVAKQPRLVKLENDTDTASSYYQEGRSAKIYIGETLIGRIGEYNLATKRSLKLPSFTAGFELGLRPLFNYIDSLKPSYSPLSRFPSTWQDISLRVRSDQAYQEVVDVIHEALLGSSLEVSVSPIDIYLPENNEYKNITFRIHLMSYDGTITGNEATAVIKVIGEAARKKLQAEVV